MMLKMKQNNVRKFDGLTKDIAQDDVHIETQRALVENLSFAQRIEAEITRTNEVDFKVIAKKKQELEARMRELEVYEDERRFNEEYFKGFL